MSNQPRIIQAPTAEHNEPVLVYVEPILKTTSLNCKLYATDGSNVYVLPKPIDETSAKSLRSQTYQGTDADWIAMLSWFLLREVPTKETGEFIANAEMVSYVKPEKSLELRIRQQVAGITQKLGSIVLECNDDIEIGLFDWANIAAAAHSSALAEKTEAQANYDSQQQTIDRLRQQLEELVEAKNNHEDQMLEKFRQLLNMKKLKIRDQQRLLATATIDSKAADQVHRERGRGVGAQQALTDRGIKRKQKEENLINVKPEPVPEEEVSEDEGFMEDQQTPEASETEDEDDADLSVTQNIPSRPGAGNEDVSQSTQHKQEPVHLQLDRSKQDSTSMGSSRIVKVDEEETDDEL